MTKREYIWYLFDTGDLDGLNRFSEQGWRVVYVEKMEDIEFGTHRGLLEREIES